jgi:hypothetical protein
MVIRVMVAHSLAFKARHNTKDSIKTTPFMTLLSAIQSGLIGILLSYTVTPLSTVLVESDLKLMDVGSSSFQGLLYRKLKVFC